MKIIMPALLMTMLWGFSQSAMAVHFAYPKWNGYALDWCKTFETDCGKPAADLWCEKKGYPHAFSFTKLSQVNYETMTVGNNAVCDPHSHGCDSFASIECQETMKTFYAPKYNGYRLDWCRVFENECGAPAASQYCQKMGYAQVANFEIEQMVQTNTMTVGSNAICNPAYHRCDSFKYVQCKH